MSSFSNSLSEEPSQEKPNFLMKNLNITEKNNILKDSPAHTEKKNQDGISDLFMKIMKNINNFININVFQIILTVVDIIGLITSSYVFDLYEENTSFER